MGLFIRWIIALGMLSAYVACSPKEFSKDPSVNPCQNFNQSCVTNQGRDYFDYNETIYGGKVDILVVDDNSASMSTEQNQLAARFSGFIQDLENRYIQYRIGIITTDVSSDSNPARPINGNGALQDGRLVTIGGAKYLTNASGTISQKDAAFKAALKRDETLQCENYIRNAAVRTGAAYEQGYLENCPSGDERGIYAANLALDNSDFIRPEANLAVIVLSDEDVRSGAYCAAWDSSNNCTSTVAQYALAAEDKHTAFVSKMQSKFPNKAYAVHSIITGTNSCLNQQNSQMMQGSTPIVRGSIGVEYSKLTYATGGVIGDICASNYTGQLSSIFSNVVGSLVDKVGLACVSPQDLTVTLTNNSDPSITWTLVGQEVRFSTKLPVGTSVNVRYSCPSL